MACKLCYGTGMLDPDSPECPACSGKPKEFVWTTRSGEKILLSKIKDDHLCNILRMLKRNVLQALASQRIKLLIVMQDDADLESNFEEDENWRELAGKPFKILENEAQRRKLNWEKS